MRKATAGLVLALIFGWLPAGEAARAQEPAAATPAPAREPAPEPEGGLSVTLESAILYGPVRGFMQTPLGGKPGTTSPKRPTLGELGLDQGAVFAGGAAASWGANTIFFGASLLSLAGDARLSEPLTSWNVAFPAGTSVHAEAAFDWYRLGYRRRFDVSPGDKPGLLTLSPGADLVYLSYQYRLEGPAAGAERDFTSPGLRLGGELAWAPADRLALAARAFESLPLPESPAIRSLELEGRFRFWESPSARATVNLGVAYNLVEYEDRQEVPNHARAEMGPLLLVGVGLEF